MELISKEVVKRIIDSGRTREQMIEMVESLESSTDDCISREELLLYLDELKDSEPKHYGFILSLQKYLRDLSSVNPQDQKWISVSERLPEEDG